MKVNAGGCTHRDKLDVVSKYKFYRPCILIHACICAHAYLGDYPVPRYMWIYIVAGGTSSLPKYLLACACAHLPTRRHLVCISTSNLVYLAIAVLYSGGSNGVGEWKVDNAVLNVARRPQATAGTSTILVK